MTFPIGRVQVDALYDPQGNLVTLPMVQPSARIAADAILGAPANDINVAGLDLNAAFGFTILVSGKVSPGGNVFFYLRLNGDFTDANYHSEYCGVTGAGAWTGATVAEPYMGGAPNNSVFFIKITIPPVPPMATPYLQYQSFLRSSVGASTQNVAAGVMYDVSATNLTSFRFSAGGMIAGTRLTVIKNVWPM